MIFQPQKKSPSASETEEGLMSAADKKKLNGIASGANAYTHPTYSTKSSGLYKVTVDSTGHISAATAVTKSDITALGIPASDTNTHYTSKNVVGSSTATSNTTSALTNGNVYLNSVENGVVTSAHKISGSGATTVTTDANGNIIISSTDTNTNTTYTANTGIKLNGTTFQHTNAVTAGTAQGDASKTLTFGGTFTIPTVTYDAQGHITAKGTTTMTMPANPNSWRGIQNNLTSDSTTDSLSAAQGKVLKGLVDGKAASSHTHDDRYYTESEVDTKLNGKAATSHGNHVPATQTANNAVFLRNDNTWQTVTPANIGAAASSHTHSAMTGATSSAAGSSGLVPAPAAGDQEKFLRGDGTWQEVSGGGSGGSSGDSLPLSGGVVTGNVQQSGATTDYTTYKFRNIGFGTTTTPTSNSTYGGSGSIYFQY